MILLCGRRKTIGNSGEDMPRTPTRGRNPGSVLTFRFQKLRQGILANNIHLEPLSEKSYNHSTNVR